jgi:cytochrome c biogenesis protein CcmG, thiol:disulfide interchange protein DsbE
VEFPHLVRLVEKYGRRGFTLLTINTMPQSDASGVAFMAKKKFPFTHLTAPTSKWATEVYKFQGAPTTVLLDRNGKVVLRHLGFSLSGLQGMDAMIGALLERGATK